MAIPSGTDGELALGFVSTIRHDGHGGVADDFETDRQVAAWVRDHWPSATVDAASLRELRSAARAVFAVTVSPAPPSRADATHLMSPATAAECLTNAIAGLELTHELRVSDGEVRTVRMTGARDTRLVLGSIALAVADFLTGPLADRLRSCQAPRCVRYFVQSHGKQQWCKHSCGNRARVAKHAARHR